MSNIDGYEQVFIYLNPEEVAFCKSLSERIDAENKNAGVIDKFSAIKETPESKKAMMFRGFIGEMAFSKYAGVPMDKTTKPRGGGHDMMVGFLSVDVKTSVWRGLAIQKDKKARPSDIYVAVSCPPGREHSPEILGCVAAEFAFDPRNRKEEGPQDENPFYLIENKHITHLKRRS